MDGVRQDMKLVGMRGWTNELGRSWRRMVCSGDP